MNNLSKNFYKEVKDILQLPKNCKSVDIKLTADSLVCIAVAFEPNSEQCGKLIEVIKKYKLVDK